MHAATKCRRMVAVVTSAVLLVGCGGDDAGGDAGASDNDGVAGANTGAAADTDEVADAAAELRIEEFAYLPQEISVPAGEPLRIVNDDLVAHTLVATSGVFDVGVAAEDDAVLTIADRGTHPFRCELHPQMTGRLIVE